MVFIADSLATPFAAVEKAFEEANPDLEIVREPSGSVMVATKIASLNRKADVIAVADYLVIENILQPKNHADWYVCFATNEIGIAKTTASKYGSEINADNWFEILSRDDVTVGAGNPEHDPCGYWTELAWKLADLHYKPETSIFERMMAKAPRKTRPSDSQQLLSRLQSAGGTDYVWVYKSQAAAHNLPFLSVPDAINLSDPASAARYGQVSIEIPKDGGTRTKRGHPIIFAITTINQSPNPEGAKRWVRFVLSDEGQRILEANFMTVTKPPYTFNLAEVPADMRDGVVEKPKPDAPSVAAQ
jgi:molybdate/tungstate transport system substrate-binding protein